MWPLSLVLLFATGAPQQQAAIPQLTPQQKQLLESGRIRAEMGAKVAEYNLLHAKDSTCYAIRSYQFRQQDGQAPIPAGMTTCTPAARFQQKWVTIEPGLKSGQTDMKIVDQEPSQQDNTCYTIRSYNFRRQDGQAPVLASTTTCTTASMLQQRQISPRPGTLYVPLGLQTDSLK